MRSRTGEFQPDDGLPHGGAGVARTRGRGDHRIIRAAALLGVQEGVEQRHAGQADGKLLRGFHLGLRLLFDALLLDFDPLRPARVGGVGVDVSQLRLQARVPVRRAGGSPAPAGPAVPGYWPGPVPSARPP